MMAGHWPLATILPRCSRSPASRGRTSIERRCADLHRLPLTVGTPRSLSSRASDSQRLPADHRVDETAYLVGFVVAHSHAVGFVAVAADAAVVLTGERCVELLHV